MVSKGSDVLTEAEFAHVLAELGRWTQSLERATEHFCKQPSVRLLYAQVREEGGVGGRRRVAFLHLLRVCRALQLSLISPLTLFIHPFPQADDWLLAMVMDAQAQSNRVTDLVEKENRAMTMWMVDLEKCLVGVPEVRRSSACAAVICFALPL